MALNDYTKQTWVDRNVSTPDDYVITKSGGGAISSGDTVTMTDSPGVTTQAGTPVNAANLNNIETQVDNITDDLIITSELTETQSTSQILSLSACDVTSKLKGALRGVTTVNLLSDNVAGCESTSGWTDTGGTTTTDSSNKLDGTNCLKFTLSGASGNTAYNIFSLLDATKYYFISAYVKNGNATNIGIQLDTDDQDVTSSTVTATTYTRIGIVVQPSDINTATTALLKILLMGANTQYAYVDAIMIQEITATEYALGATALLSKYQYHRGLMSSNPIMINSVGKNLFDKNDIITGETIVHTTGVVSASSIYGRTSYRQIKPSTTYITTNLGTATGSGIAFYNKKLNYISGISLTTLSGGSFETPTNAEYYRLAYRSDTQNINTIQLEEGSTATDFEEYKETKTFTTPTLRSVSASIYDTYNVNSGLHTQNVNIDSDISSTQYDSIDTATYTNVDVVKTTAFPDMLTPTTSTDGTTKVINKDNMILTEVSQANIDLTASVGKYYTHTDKTIWFIVGNGTYADIASARTGLGTSKALYQLATPIQTQYPSNVVNAYKDGTVYTLPAIQETAYYDTGITVNASYPISNLLKVYKINTTNNTQTPVSLSNCTVASGGASFTISGASDGELYGYEYKYNFLSTVPTLSYNYASNTITSQKGTHELLSELQKRTDNTNINNDARIDGLENKYVDKTILDAAGDIIYASANNTPAKLAIGTTGKSLVVSGGVPAWGYQSEAPYVPSDTVILTANTERQNTSATYSVVKAFKVGRSGSVRVKGEMKSGNASYNPYLKIDNLNTGETFRDAIVAVTLNYGTFTYDIRNGGIQAGETIQLSIKRYSDGGSSFIKNVTVCADVGVIADTVVTD